MLIMIIMIKIIIKKFYWNYFVKLFNFLKFCKRINFEGIEFCLNGFLLVVFLGRVVMNENFNFIFDYCLMNLIDI